MMHPAVVDRVGMIRIDLVFFVRGPNWPFATLAVLLAAVALHGIPCHRQTKRLLLCHEVWSCFCCSFAPS